VLQPRLQEARALVASIVVASEIAAELGRMIEDKKRGKPKYVGLGFHDLRRTNATGLVAPGVDVKTAQGLLGHSDSRLTLDHYARWSPSSARLPPRRWAQGS
jgi:integrase